MKSNEEKLDDEGFEEVEVKAPDSHVQSGAGNRPDFRIVQTDRDRDGNVVYSNIGGMWKNISKNGKTFYTLRIGQLKLLVFENDKKL